MHTKLQIAKIAGVSIAGILLASWLPLMLVVVMGFDAPGSDYNIGLNSLYQLMIAYPIPLGLALVGAGISGASRMRSMIATIALWGMSGAVIIMIVACLVTASSIDPVELDRFQSESERRLIASIGSGNVEYVRSYISEGGSLEFCGERGINPLYAAIVDEQWDIVELIANSGCNMNYMPRRAGFFGPSLLVIPPYAWDANRLQHLDRLLTAGLDPDLMIGKSTLFRAAISSDRAPMLKMLLRYRKAGAVTQQSMVADLESAISNREWQSASVLLDLVPASELAEAVALMDSRESRQVLGEDVEARAAFRVALQRRYFKAEIEEGPLKRDRSGTGPNNPYQ